MRATDFITDASFWIPDLFVPSAWTEHAPFAFWLVQQHRPSCLVELGTHHGFSFLALAKAVANLKTGTRCFAIDTWKGDEHAGLYGEDVYQSLSERISRRYSSFCQLVRSTFDEAVVYFPDSSIDLLHIDGRHFYDDVLHDFETWLPKLSTRAVVLFHDVAVREREFGAIKVWNELKQKYPHFEFVHGWGLGVLGVGNDLPEVVRSLFMANGRTELAAEIRDIYGRLGSGLLELSNRLASGSEIDRLKEAIAEAEVEKQRLANEITSIAQDSARLSNELQVALTSIQEISEVESENRRLKEAIAAAEVEKQRLANEITGIAQDRARVADELNEAMTSIQAVSRVLAEKTASFDQVHSDNSSLKATIDDLEEKLKNQAVLSQNALGELEGENAFLVKQNAAACNRIDALVVEISNSHANEAQAAELARSSAEEIVQADSQIKNLSGELESARRRLDRYWQTQNHLQRSYGEELARYKKLLAHEQDLKQSLDRPLRDKDDAARQSASDYEQKIAEITSELVSEKRIVAQ